MLIEPSPKGGDGCPEGLDSSGGGLAQDCLELGEELLDRVEVWRVAPRASMVARTPATLCELRLSRITMSPGRSVGASTFST
jgi:hypothetical protein